MTDFGVLRTLRCSDKTITICDGSRPLYMFMQFEDGWNMIVVVKDSEGDSFSGAASFTYDELSRFISRGGMAKALSDIGDIHTDSPDTKAMMVGLHDIGFCLCVLDYLNQHAETPNRENLHKVMGIVAQTSSNIIVDRVIEIMGTTAENIIAFIEQYVVKKNAFEF